MKKKLGYLILSFALFIVSWLAWQLAKKHFIGSINEENAVYGQLCLIMGIMIGTHIYSAGLCIGLAFDLVKLGKSKKRKLQSKQVNKGTESEEDT